MYKYRVEQKGFTILELLIVIVIIGILATIALPKYIGVREDANIAVSKSNIKSLQTGIERYLLDKGLYPAELSELITEGLIKEGTCRIPGTSNIYEYGNSDTDYLIYDPDNDVYATSDSLAADFATYTGDITPNAQTI